MGNKFRVRTIKNMAASFDLIMKLAGQKEHEYGNSILASVIIQCRKIYFHAE